MKLKQIKNSDVQVMAERKTVKVNMDMDWDLDENGEAIYTEENYQAYRQAIQELEDGDVLTLDIEKAQTFDGFMSQLNFQ
jgi:hypothetical protein